MSTDLFHAAGLPASPLDLKKAIAAARRQAPVRQGVQFMKMNQAGSPNEGQLTYGRDAQEVSPDSVWAVPWQGIEHGFLLRDNANVNHELYAPIFSDMPDTGAAQTQAAGVWRQAYRVRMVCVSGPDEGAMVEYGGDALGVVRFITNTLLPAIEARVDEDGAKLHAMVIFAVRSYFSKRNNKEIFEAEGTIDSWMGDKKLARLVDSYGKPDADDGKEAKAAAPEKPARRPRRLATDTPPKDKGKARKAK